jgi:hypothetical protein
VGSFGRTATTLRLSVKAEAGRLLKDTFVTKGSLVKICGSSSFSNTPWLATGLFIQRAVFASDQHELLPVVLMLG